MTDLSRSEIEWMREDSPSVVTNGAFQTLCDMALAKKDAEAECERLQRELYDARFLAQNFQKRWGNLCDQLAQYEGWTIEAVEQASSKGLPEGAPHTPQQAHGDALAVVERIEGNLCGPSGRLNEPVAHIFKSDLDCIRQALTASGVPYVPEEVRRLPDEMREQAGTVHEAGEYNEDGAAGWADASNTWAEQLERALASAPAVPGKYGEHSADVVADSNWSAGARFGWNCAIAGDKDRMEKAIQSRIDERAQIAAAPTDGRE